MPEEPAPRLSVLLTCTEPWPGIARMLDGLLPQLVPGVEVLVLASVPSPLPEGWSHPAVRVLARPGASTFELRAEGLREARGALVGISEDHAAILPGWVEALLEADARHPEADAFVGPVGIGAPRLRSARAHHLYLFDEWTPPLQPTTSRTLPLANIALRRRAILRPVPTYWLEDTLVPGLRATGRVALVPGMRADHTQDYTALQAARAHFHNARAGGGHAGRPERLATAAYWVHRTVWARVQGARRNLRRIDDPVGPVTATLLLLPIYAANVAGTIVGWLAGPGNSPQKVP